MEYFKRARKNWVGSNLDFGRKSVRYPYDFIKFGYRIFSASEKGEKKKLFSDLGRPIRVPDVHYGYWAVFG